MENILIFINKKVDHIPPINNDNLQDKYDYWMDERKKTKSGMKKIKKEINERLKSLESLSNEINSIIKTNNIKIYN